MFSLCHHGLLPAAKRHSCYVNWWMWEWTVACLCVSSDWLVTCPRCTPSLSLLAQWPLNWVSGKKSMYVICYRYYLQFIDNRCNIVISSSGVFSVNSYYSVFILRSRLLHRLYVSDLVPSETYWIPSVPVVKLSQINCHSTGSLIFTL